MAFDCEPWEDPRGPSCPKCARPIKAGEPFTIMHFHEDPHGRRGLSGKRWHAECARPAWDNSAEILERLRRSFG